MPRDDSSNDPVKPANEPKLLTALLIGGGLTLSIMLTTMQIVSAVGSSPRHKPPLQVSPEHLDIGQQTAQPAFCWQIPINNISAEEVFVTRLRSTCSCTTVEPSSFRLLPGQSQVVTLVIDLTPPPGQPMTMQESPFGVTLEPTIAGYPFPVASWRVHGTIKNAFSPDQMKVALVGGASLKSTHLTEPLKIVGIQATEQVDRIELSTRPSSVPVAISRVSATERWSVTLLPQEFAAITKFDLLETV